MKKKIFLPLLGLLSITLLLYFGSSLPQYYLRAQDPLWAACKNLSKETFVDDTLFLGNKYPEAAHIQTVVGNNWQLEYLVWEWDKDNRNPWKIPFTFEQYHYHGHLHVYLVDGKVDLARSRYDIYITTTFYGLDTQGRFTYYTKGRPGSSYQCR